jgi:biotin carboxyl carrier protein
MRYFVTIAGRELEVDLTGARPVVDGREVEVHLAALPGTRTRHLLVDGRSHAIQAHPGSGGGEWEIAIGAERYSALAVDERTRAIREMTGDTGPDPAKRVVAPMPGMVLKVEVEVGQSVRAGQGVVVVEAMKMENELKAPGDGVVVRIEVTPGQTVEKGATLIVLE